MNIILFETGEIGTSLPRRDERTIHLLKVLHKKAGDSFDAGVLGGGRCTGSIEKINRDGSLTVSLGPQEEEAPRLPIRVAVGFPRPIQIRRLLRDLSSLGVEAVDLMGTELGEKSYRDTKLFDLPQGGGGAHAALIEGAVQSRDTTIPALAVFDRMEDWLRQRPWDSPQAGGAASVAATTVTAAVGPIPLLIAADNIRPEGAMSRIAPTKRPVVLAIGPERGWSDHERDMLENAGFLRLSVGSRALRTETACVAATVLALEKIGALG